MPTWDGLFAQIDRADPLERRLSAERAAFERWAVAAEQRIMSEIARHAGARARETRTRTGLIVDISARVGTSEIASFGGAHRLVSLSLAGSSIDLYSVRAAGESPIVHLACERAPTSSRFPVIVTVPGCLVVRSYDSGARLLALPGCEPTTVDELVLRAFTLLFGAHQSVAAEHRSRPLPCV